MTAALVFRLIIGQNRCVGIEEMQRLAGTQLGTFEGRDLIHKEMHSKNLFRYSLE